jgi:hypothetical protein
MLERSTRRVAMQIRIKDGWKNRWEYREDTNPRDLRPAVII